MGGEKQVWVKGLVGEERGRGGNMSAWWEGRLVGGREGRNMRAQGEDPSAPLSQKHVQIKIGCNLPTYMYEYPHIHT